MSTPITTQATPKADQKPAAIELNGVFERHELPVRTALLLNNEGLRQISTALAARITSPWRAPWAVKKASTNSSAMVLTMM